MAADRLVSEMRIGQGIDVHRLVPGGPLRLGGIAIPNNVHLEGHSDGDVVAHAIADAILSAAYLGDLGTFLPADDPTIAGIAGTEVLRRVAKALAQQGAKVGNVDCSVMCDCPPLAEHVPAMTNAVAMALSVSTRCISIKPRHAEGLGFVGREEGILAMAVALVTLDSP